MGCFRVRCMALVSPTSSLFFPCNSPLATFFCSVFSFFPFEFGLVGRLDIKKNHCPSRVVVFLDWTTGSSFFDRRTSNIRGTSSVIPAVPICLSPLSIIIGCQLQISCFLDSSCTHAYTHLRSSFECSFTVGGVELLTVLTVPVHLVNFSSPLMHHYSIPTFFSVIFFTFTSERWILDWFASPRSFMTNQAARSHLTVQVPSFVYASIIFFRCFPSSLDVSLP